MNEEKRSLISAFRFGVIHDLIGDTELETGEQERLIRDKCYRKWLIPFSDKTRITRSTILRWVRLYKESGGKLDALCNHERCDQSSLTFYRSFIPRNTKSQGLGSGPRFHFLCVFASTDDCA